MADQVYKKLLQERLSEPPDLEPARKRRRGALQSQDPIPHLEADKDGTIPIIELEDRAENDLSDDSFDSEDFEDVEIGHHDAANGTIASLDLVYDVSQNIESTKDSFTVTLSGPEEKKSTSSRRRLPTVSKEERARRRTVHRLFLAVFLAHGAIRNRWCNDYRLQTRLRRLVSPQTRLLLFPDDKLAAMVRSRRFLDGVRQLMELYSARFRITAKGLIRKNWAQMGVIQANTESKMTFAKFVALAEGLYGSRDLGAQGFVSLLRLVGLHARLVFSLQPPDHTAITEVQKTEEAPQTLDSSKVRARGSARMRLLARMRAQPVVSTKDTETAPDSEYPIFWAEVWNKHSSKWIAVDPMVLKTVEDVPLRRKSRFEPPATDSSNQLLYSIAYDRLGGVKDVTRRYSHFYNAKTVKKRLNSRSEEDSFWYSRLIRACCSTLRRGKTSGIDALELKEFYKRDLAEGIPNNIGDFKNHPLYVLESQLHQNEIIYPKDDTSKCGTYQKKTTGNNQAPVVPIYKRSSVVLLRSAKAWYMRGRVLKVGAQPLKTKKKAVLAEEDDEDVALYGEFQTLLYVPPAIEDGKVPKNAYGNIDIYVPTMVPENGFLVDASIYPLKMQERAARLIMVDYAKAIVAFDFGGKDGKKASRMPTAKEGGILIDVQFKEALFAVLDFLVEEEEENKRAAAELESLRNWKFFITKLRITARLNKHHGEIEKKEEEKKNRRKSKIQKAALDSESEFEDEESDFSAALSSDGFEEGGFVAGDHVREGEREEQEDEGHEKGGKAGGFNFEEREILSEKGGQKRFANGGGFINEGGLINEGDDEDEYVNGDGEEGGGFNGEGGFLTEADEQGGFPDEKEGMSHRGGGLTNDTEGSGTENENLELLQNAQNLTQPEDSDQKLNDELDQLPDEFFRQNEHGEWVYDPQEEEQQENAEKGATDVPQNAPNVPEAGSLRTTGSNSEHTGFTAPVGGPTDVSVEDNDSIAAKSGDYDPFLAQKKGSLAETRLEQPDILENAANALSGPIPQPQRVPEASTVLQVYLQENTPFTSTRTPSSQESDVLLEGSIAEYEASVRAQEDQLGFEYELE